MSYKLRDKRKEDLIQEGIKQAEKCGGGQNETDRNHAQADSLLLSWPGHVAKFVDGSLKVAEERFHKFSDSAKKQCFCKVILGLLGFSDKRFSRRSKFRIADIDRL